MKLIHLSDLHLGKRVNEFSMLEDQKYILKEILAIIDEEAPDAVLLAGDVYDKSFPPTEAVELFDDFLVQLAQRQLQVFVISGNHDSAERIAFGGRIMAAGGVHMAPVYHGNVEPAELTDEYGCVNIYMLPFIKPIHVRRFFPDETIESYTDAMRTAIAQMKVNELERNVLITHQFVTGSQRSDSEDLSVGGTDHVDADVFSCFDYTALGHLHNPQNCGSEKIRYCGTPLKYSFSEASHQKSVTIVEMGPKGSCTIRTKELIPLREMRELKGSYAELTLKSSYADTTYQEDYIHITLTDEDDIPDAVGKLRTIYHNLMKLDYDNLRTRKNSEVTGAVDAETKTPLELFEELYQEQNNQPMNEAQRTLVQNMIEEIWEEKV